MTVIKREVRPHASALDWMLDKIYVPSPISHAFEHSCGQEQNSLHSRCNHRFWFEYCVHGPCTHK